MADLPAWPGYQEALVAAYSNQEVMVRLALLSNGFDREPSGLRPESAPDIAGHGLLPRATHDLAEHVQRHRKDQGGGLVAGNLG